MRRLEQSEISTLETIDILLSEELTLQAKSGMKTALRMGRPAIIKTLSGFDFSFQPSLNSDRTLGSSIARREASTSAAKKQKSSEATFAASCRSHSISAALAECEP